MIRNFTVREFMQRWASIPVSTGGGEYTPAKTPGLFAAMEKAYSAMIVAAFTGSHAGVGIGHLDGGLVISPEQLLLDREMASALRHLNPIEITPETISLDAIQEVGHAEKTNYMECDNTLRHYRSALWIPELLERLGWTGLKTEEQVLGRARQKVADLVASYKRPDVDEGKLEKMRQIVARARKKLCEETRT
jgi:trimethylamine:corrinoid methyltransferase-like protein